MPPAFWPPFAVVYTQGATPPVWVGPVTVIPTAWLTSEAGGCTSPAVTAHDGEPVFPVFPVFPVLVEVVVVVVVAVVDWPLFDGGLELELPQAAKLMAATNVTMKAVFRMSISWAFVEVEAYLIGPPRRSSPGGQALAPYTTVSGLTPGQSYTFKVQATNAAGSGTLSGISKAITP
jgi:hypothetical protein